MKPRARRAVIGAAALGAALAIILVSVGWGTVRDHVQAWNFQLTRETVTAMAETPCTNSSLVGRLCFELADRSGCPAIFAPEEPIVICAGVGGGAAAPRSARSIIGFLQWAGYRTLEQSFPRKAYVVIRTKP
jgi:hypothetical protein